MAGIEAEGATMANANVGQEPWRVGVLFSQTGVTAVIEETQFAAPIMAIEEINAAGGMNGRELVPIFYNPASEDRATSRVSPRSF